jgi:hypothetical protein
LGKNAIKISKEHLSILEKLFQLLCNKNIDVPLILQDINVKLTQKSDSYIDDINGPLAQKNIEPDVWKSVSSSPVNMKAFSIENNFTDPVQDNAYWEPLISTWYLIYAERPPVTSINAIRLSSTMTLKTLRALSKSVSEIIGISIPTEKSEEKKTLLSFTRGALPEICSRGHNFHMELERVAQTIKSNTITRPLPVFSPSPLDPYRCLSL